MPELLSAEQTADLLKLERQTLANWRVLGKGPRFLKLGGRVLYPLDEINTWLAACPLRTSTSDSGAVSA